MTHAQAIGPVHARRSHKKNVSLAHFRVDSAQSSGADYEVADVDYHDKEFSCHSSLTNGHPEGRALLENTRGNIIQKKPTIRRNGSENSTLFFSLSASRALMTVGYVQQYSQHYAALKKESLMSSFRATGRIEGPDTLTV